VINCNIFSGKWEEVESLPTARNGLSCGLVTKTDTGEQEIIAAGGYSGVTHSTLDTVKIFSVHTKSWRRAGRMSVREKKTRTE
jgi:hypothetical protein